jgi:type IV secretory pathway VirD2 relaxase
MPPGTSPDKVLEAVRNFAREEFWGQHRYAFVLHTDEPHPHVHLLLKAVDEEGVRLSIKKTTLRRWRSEFARNLRLLGVAANATERAVRGQGMKAKKDGIYRASQRGDSTYVRAQTEVVAAELVKGSSRVELGKRTLAETRRKVVSGWQNLAISLAQDGHRDIAISVQRLIDRMPPPRTEKELVAARLLERTRAREQEVSR